MQKPINFDQIWLEDRDKDEVIAANMVHYNDVHRQFHFQRTGSAFTGVIIANRLDYGSRWRAWTHKPTDEERKAAEWR